MIVEKREIYGSRVYEVVVSTSEGSLDNVMFIEGFYLTMIDWKVTEEEISEILDYIASDDIFSNRILKTVSALNRNKKFMLATIDETSLPKIREFIAAGFPKSLSVLMVMINNDSSLNLSTIAEIAQHGVVQINEQTKESTLEMLYVLSRKMPYSSVVKVFKEYGQTFNKQKQTYEALIAIPEEIAQSISKFDSIVMNFIVNYAEFIAEDLKKNDQTMKNLIEALNKIQKQNYNEFEFYYKLFLETGSRSMASELSKEYKIPEDKIQSVLNTLSYEIREADRRFRTLSTEDEQKMLNRRNYLSQYYAIIFTAYGLNAFIYAYEKVKNISYMDRWLTINHLIALAEYEKDFGGEMSPNLIFNIAGLPQLTEY